MKRVRRRYVIWSAFILVGAGVAAGFWLTRESPLSAAKRMIGCALRADGECLMRYMTPEEASMLGLTGAKLESLLRTILIPSFSGFETNGPPLIEEWQTMGTIGVSQGLRHADGRTASLFFVVGRVPGGLQATNIVTNVVTSAVNARWPANKPFPRGARLARFWAEEFTRSLPQLKSTGIDGLMLETKPSPSRLTWQEFIDRQWKHVAMVEKAASGNVKP